MEEINSNSNKFIIHKCEADVFFGINCTDGINIEVLVIINEEHLNWPVLGARQFLHNFIRQTLNPSAYPDRLPRNNQ